MTYRSLKGWHDTSFDHSSIGCTPIHSKIATSSSRHTASYPVSNSHTPPRLIPVGAYPSPTTFKRYKVPSIPTSSYEHQSAKACRFSPTSPAYANLHRTMEGRCDFLSAHYPVKLKVHLREGSSACEEKITDLTIPLHGDSKPTILVTIEWGTDSTANYLPFDLHPSSRGKTTYLASPFLAGGTRTKTRVRDVFQQDSMGRWYVVFNDSEANLGGGQWYWDVRCREAEDRLDLFYQPKDRPAMIVHQASALLDNHAPVSRSARMPFTGFTVIPFSEELERLLDPRYATQDLERCKGLALTMLFPILYWSGNQRLDW